MKGKGSIEILVPPEKIWPLIVEPSNILQWHPCMKRIEFVGDKHSGVGAMFYTEGKMDGQIMRSLNIIMEWEDNKKLSFGIILADMIKRWDATWAIESTDKGSRMTIMYDGTLPYGILGQIMGMFLSKRYQEATKDMLLQLKRLAESKTD